MSENLYTELSTDSVDTLVKAMLHADLLQNLNVCVPLQGMSGDIVRHQPILYMADRQQRGNSDA